MAHGISMGVGMLGARHRYSGGGGAAIYQNAGGGGGTYGSTAYTDLSTSNGNFNAGDGFVTIAYPKAPCPLASLG